MEGLNVVNAILRNVTPYRLWQAPFAESKLAPLEKYNNLNEIRRVLDVGCGPGTNTSRFKHCDYLGLDWNRSYIEYATRQYGRKFIATDVLDYRPPADVSYDFILVNSFLHHIDDSNASRILSKLAGLLAPDGHIHILDLVLPDRPSIGRLLAQWDRGLFARPLERWRDIFVDTFTPVTFEPYPLCYFGVTLWNMVYFKGKARE